MAQFDHFCAPPACAGGAQHPRSASFDAHFSGHVGGAASRHAPGLRSSHGLKLSREAHAKILRFDHVWRVERHGFGLCSVISAQLISPARLLISDRLLIEDRVKNMYLIKLLPQQSRQDLPELSDRFWPPMIFRFAGDCNSGLCGSAQWPAASARH